MQGFTVQFGDFAHVEPLLHQSKGSSHGALIIIFGGSW
jgi:hypothetical protein